MGKLRLNLKLGETIGGCRLERFIGRGAMGEVYEARQVSLDRRVALKVAAPSAADESGARFLKEARLAARLNHPNIVQIFDVGQENERGLLYMILEFVDGVTLKEVLARDEKCPIDRLYRVALKAARGLAVAHREHIVHRDIKPENIMLTSYGDMKITDFGAASLLVGDDEAEGNLVGTPMYMAPEVILRSSSDGRADVYALGLILYETASGRRPFPYKQVKEILRAQLGQNLDPLEPQRSELDPAFAQLIERLCAKKPHERHSSEDLVEILEAHREWEKEWSPPQPTRTAASGEVSSLPPGPDAPAGGILNAPLRIERRSHREEVETLAREMSVLEEQKKKAEARRAREREAAARRESDPRVGKLCILARFQLMKKNWEQAESLLEEALRLEPNNEEALLSLARLLTDRNRYDEATAVLRKIVEGGNVDTRKILDSHHFDALRQHREFRRLMAKCLL